MPDVEPTADAQTERLFPFSEIHQWLSYANVQKKYFAHREFSFTFQNDIYSRFNSFVDCEAFKKHVLSGVPVKMDFGAVYNVAPKDKASVAAFTAQEKEMVFDVDMDAFDGVRTCCTGASICNKCWPFMTVFIKVADKMLREDFGFEQILWVYSGRRGVHCWVCDERARKLSLEMRNAIISYFSVVEGEGQKGYKQYLPATLHPSLQQAYSEVLLPIFDELVLENQGMMDTTERREKILAFITDKDIQSALREQWEKEGSSTTPQKKWNDLKKTVNDGLKRKTNKFQYNTNPIQDIVFNFTYPRLDAAVSKDLGHLLKAPFTVHPATGRVCVPIDPEKCDKFDPFAVPTVASLINEMDQYTDDKATKKDSKRTQLGHYIGFFKKQFLQPLNDSLRSQVRAQEDSKMEF